MTDGVEVLQDVIVFGVDVDGAAVLVDVYGGRSNLCGSVRFHMPEPERRDTAVGLIERWCRRSTPLTLIVRGRGSSIILQNDHEVFGAQLTPPALEH